MPLFILEDTLMQTQPTAGRLPKANISDLMDVLHSTSDKNAGTRHMNQTGNLIKFGRRSSKASSSKNAQSVRNSNAASTPAPLDQFSGTPSRPMTTQTSSNVPK